MSVWQVVDVITGNFDNCQYVILPSCQSVNLSGCQLVNLSMGLHVKGWAGLLVALGASAVAVCRTGLTCGGLGETTGRLGSLCRLLHATPFAGSRHASGGARGSDTSADETTARAACSGHPDNLKPGRLPSVSYKANSRGYGLDCRVAG